MAWWNVIGDVFKGGKDVAEVFTENKENRGQRKHDQIMADTDRDLAALAQFAQEFHTRKNRTWWDSFVDGLNRLPRPILTIAVLSFFVLAPLDPERFLIIAQSYQLMPPGYWALLSVIIGFYFGGRMQLKSQDFAVTKSAVVAAKELVEMKKEFRKLAEDLDTPESQIYDAVRLGGNQQIKNAVVQKWLSSQ